MKEQIERALGALLKGMAYAARTGAKFGAGLVGRSAAHLPVTLKNVYRFECRDAAGNLRWVEEVPNLITTAGLDDLLTQYLSPLFEGL